MVLVLYKLVLWCQHLCVPTTIQDNSLLLLSLLKLIMLNPDFILNLKLFNSFSSRRLVCKPLVLCIPREMFETAVMFCHYPSAFPDLSGRLLHQKNSSTGCHPRQGLRAQSQTPLEGRGERSYPPRTKDCLMSHCWTKASQGMVLQW